MKRTNKNTVAYWIRKLGFKIELWNVYTNHKTEQASLTVSCYGPDMSTHEFYF